MVVGVLTLVLALMGSFFLFRPVANAFAAGTLNYRVALIFFLHMLGGAGIMLGAFLAARALNESSGPAVVAAAVGWTVPSIGLAIHTYRRYQRTKKTKEEADNA